MEPISGADQIILLLRQKLAERARAGRKERSNGHAAQELANAETSLVKQLASIEGVDEHQLRRALVQNILVEQFGTTMLNDAQFQQVVSRVSDALQEDADTAKLMAQVLSELRTSG